MAKYKIEVTKSAAQELAKIPKKDLQKIIRKISTLAQNQYPLLKILKNNPKIIKNHQENEKF